MSAAEAAAQGKGHGGVPPLDDSLLLCKLMAVVRDIDAAAWAEAAQRRARDARVGCEHRGLTWAFLQEWLRGLHWVMRGDEGATARLNSYMLVGDKDLSDQWQGDFGRDPSVCLPWCLRALAVPTTLSVVETLQIAAELTGDRAFVEDPDTGQPYFGTATQFVSYYWRAPFVSLLSAMRSEGAAEAGPESFFWVDIFCVAQCKHTPAAVAFNQQDVSAFEQVLSVVTATWLWCEPWHNPRTLQRVWCLFEALKTLDFGKSLQLTMSAAEKDSMQATLVHHFDGIMDTISSMDVSRAEATQAQDREFIFGLIDMRQGGLTKFNADIVKALRGWLLGSVLQRLATLRGSGGSGGGAGEAAGAAGADAADAVAASAGGGGGDAADEGGGTATAKAGMERDSDELDEIRTGATRLLDLLGRFSESLPLHLEGLEHAEAVSGTHHPEHARRLVALGRCLQDMNRFSEAEERLRAGLAVLEEHRGGRDIEVLSALNNLTHLHNQRSQFAEAVVLARRVVEGCDATAVATAGEPVGAENAGAAGASGGGVGGGGGRGGDGPDEGAAAEAQDATPGLQRRKGREEQQQVLCAALNNLANALRSQGDLAAARPIYVRSCALREELYGAKHPSVALARNNLANLLFLEGQFAEALDMHQKVLAGRVEIFGPGHYYCSTSRKNIGLCLQRLGRLNEAEEQFVAALTAREKLFGALHSKTAEALALLGDLRVAQDRAADALQLYRRAREAWRHAHKDQPGGAASNPTVARADRYIALLEAGEALPEGEPLARFI